MPIELDTKELVKYSITNQLIDDFFDNHLLYKEQIENKVNKIIEQLTELDLSNIVNEILQIRYKEMSKKHDLTSIIDHITTHYNVKI